MSKDLNAWRYKPKNIYILKIFEEGMRKYFVLCKKAKGQYQWQSLNDKRASSNYFGIGVPKKKALRWARESGTIKKIKLFDIIPHGE